MMNILKKCANSVSSEITDAMKLIGYTFGVCGPLLLFLSSCNLPGSTSSGNTTSTSTLEGVPTVLDPNGPLRSWKIGSTYDISWSVGDAGTNVKVELLKNDASYLVISKSVFNSGGMTWQIPGSVAPGTDYKIRVTGVTQPNMTDKSDDNFAIE